MFGATRRRLSSVISTLCVCVLVVSFAMAVGSKPRKKSRKQKETAAQKSALAETRSCGTTNDSARSFRFAAELGQRRFVEEFQPRLQREHKCGRGQRLGTIRPPIRKLPHPSSRRGPKSKKWTVHRRPLDR